MNRKTAAIFSIALCAGILAAAETPSSKRVPEPRPVKGPIEVHAFYYPGTEQMAEWDQVDQTLPGIKPLLGWYDEGNPSASTTGSKPTTRPATAATSSGT